MNITCINARGQKIEFGWKRPFWMSKPPSGLGAEYEISTYQIHGMDGALYSGAQAKQRNIVLTVSLLKKDGLAALRDRLYSFFQRGESGTLIVSDGSINRQATYQAESVSVEGDGPVRTATISLICPDPLFYATEDSYTRMASFDPLIEFDFFFNEDFAVEEKTQDLIKALYNDSVEVGMQIRYTAAGTVVDPVLEDVGRGVSLTIETTMEPGDEILIDTGKKTVIRTRNGEQTNLINAFTWESEWLTFKAGDNLFRFGAKEGTDLLSAVIITRKGYWGA